MSGDIIEGTFDKIFSDHNNYLEELEIEYENTGEDEYLMAYEVLCDGFDRLLDNLREILDDTDDEGYLSEEQTKLHEKNLTTKQRNKRYHTTLITLSSGISQNY